MEQLVYQLKVSVEGAGNHIVLKGVLWTLIPAALAEAVLAFAVIKVNRRIFSIISVLMLGIFIMCFGMYSWNRLGVGEYLAAEGTDSDFIEQQYVDPNSVTITFPDQKRNLIYIFLESMEITYADRASGGGFEDNVISDLTELAVANEDFSGAEDTLNGGCALSGATWTIAGMFAQTAGLPLKISIEGNSMSSLSGFFPSITTIGDILETEGYRNVLMIGSQATFAGRDHYFSSHGDYEIMDYTYAVENSWIPGDYYVFWGYEDEKLFANAENELLELASSDQPFNFTMLTVDTHFEDGYVCELCDTTYGDNQYANVMHCSSAQVAAFVEWIQQQDFYENTTIVISGDHLTMDSDFCEDVEEDYQRKVYTAYIHSAIEPESDVRREYSTMDNFPTTLEALGVSIEGRKLGLGTSLFSTVPTLVETYGVEELNSELSNASSFMEKLSTIDYDELSAITTFQVEKESDDEMRVNVANEAATIGTVYLLAYDENDSLIEKISCRSREGCFYLKSQEVIDNTSYFMFSYVFEADEEQKEYTVDYCYYPEYWPYY